MDRLTAEDRLMLWSDEGWPQDIGALAVLDGSALLDSDGRFRIDAAREEIERRLHLLPRFRQILYQPRRGRGWPLWVDAPGFDLRDHARVAQVPDPGDEAQLLLATEQLRCHRLDRSRPLWEICFLPGLPDARIGLFIRLHHVIADGIASVAGLGSLLDADPGTTTAPAPPWTPGPPPTDRELLGDNLRRRADELSHAVNVFAHPATTLRHGRAGWPAMREILAQQPGPRTSLNRLVGPRRSLALIRSDLDLVTQVAHAHAATVNDVLLAMTAGGLRGLLRSRGEPVDGLTLPIYVPVSLRRDRTRPGAGNLISQMVVPLPLGTSDPGDRLRQIAAATTIRKANTRPSLGTVFRSKVLARAMLPLIAKKRVNIESADLPGPPAPLYFSGAQLLEVFPLLNLIGNVSLGVGALSYAGQFNIMAVGDADAYPDIEVFTASARNELQTLSGARKPVTQSQ
ncbi:MAG TPA: wax ester/triacylglycerol synthase domain-containing protein [Mycobacterium sp.]